MQRIEQPRLSTKEADILVIILFNRSQQQLEPHLANEHTQCRKNSGTIRQILAL